MAVLLPLLAGCSPTPAPRVKITYSDIIQEAPAPASETSPPSEAISDGTPADLATGTVTSQAERTEGTLRSLGVSISTKDALEKALTWATEGLRLYERGDYDAAHKSLSDARLMLLEADLPDFLEDQGLGALRSGLPEELRQYDIEAIARDLERMDQPNTAEQAERALVDREVRRILRQFGDTSPEERDLEILVDETYHYINFFRGRYRIFFERAFLRKHKYWPQIQEVFRAKKLPPDLGYVALVESGFNPRAISRAKAIGLWQFIPETGRRYGLQNHGDFHDVRKSTTAAADYLLDLISIFSSRSFLLATAAYNAGEGRILGCLRKIDDPFHKRSFWEIRSCLALETREYVPKVMAAAVIGADPKRFGFNLPSEEEMLRRYDVVIVQQVTSLARLAELAGVDIADLLLINSDLATPGTSTPGRNFPLYVPLGTREHIAAALATTPDEKLPSVALPGTVEIAQTAPPRPATRTYVVRAGDTLSAIAEKYSLNLEILANWNGLRKPYVLKIGQSLLIPPDRESRSRIVYTVKAGNTLRAIADLFGVNSHDIARWNNLRNNKIKTGQKLDIYSKANLETRTYRVRRGDNLTLIANRFGVSIEHLMTANGLRSSTLRTGLRLVVYVVK